MKWILTLSVLTFLSSVLAVDYACPDGKSKKSITIKKDQTFNFDVAPGYGAKTKCSVMYKPSKSKKTKCKKLKFSCTTFDLPNKDAKKCRKGDKLKVGKQFFCKSKSPSIQSTKPIKLMFLSDKKDSSGSATCTIECVGSTPAPTPSPPTTTTGPLASTTTTTTTTPTTTSTASTTPWNCECGVKESRSSKENWILGGVETGVNDWPWMAMLTTRPGNSFFCGGSVINSRWIATAAHCVSSTGQVPAYFLLSKKSFWIVLGEHMTNNATESNITKKFAVEDIIVHKNKKGNPSQVDIALVKVTEDIDVSIYTPICLAEAGFDVRAHGTVTLTGWGLTECPDPDNNPYCNGGSASTTLQEILLPVVSREECSTIIGTYGSGKVYCWGGDTGESGCFGDSGSPLMVSSDSGSGVQVYSQAGSVMGGTGPGCGGAGTYGLAWQTAVYNNWYLTNAGGDDVNWCNY